MREAFGRPLSYFFDEFEEQPVASGSIAQVHRAILSERGAAETGFPVGTMVAVKVSHLERGQQGSREWLPSGERGQQGSREG